MERMESLARILADLLNKSNEAIENTMERLEDTPAFSIKRYEDLSKRLSQQKETLLRLTENDTRRKITYSPWNDRRGYRKS